MTLSIVSNHECSLDKRIDGVVVLILLCKIHHKEACSSSAENQLQRKQSKDGLLRCDFYSHIPDGAFPNLTCSFMYSPHGSAWLTHSPRVYGLQSGLQSSDTSLPRNLLYMQLIEPYPRPSESTTLGLGQWTCVLPSTPGDSEVPPKFENYSYRA